MSFAGKPNFQALATRMTERNGVQCTYTSITNGVYDLDTSSIVQSSVATSCKIRPCVLSKEEVNSPNLVGLDARAFIISGASLANRPKPEDTITIASEIFTVIKTAEYAGNNSEVAYWRVLTKRG